MATTSPSTMIGTSDASRSADETMVHPIASIKG
jgi:hypothetical protein